MKTGRAGIGQPTRALLDQHIPIAMRQKRRRLRQSSLKTRFARRRAKCVFAQAHQQSFTREGIKDETNEREHSSACAAGSRFARRCGGSANDHPQSLYGERMSAKGTRTMNAIRWGDSDHYLGPLTWSYSSAYPHWSITLGSHGDEDSDSWMRRSALHIHLGKATLIVALPGIIRPWRQKRYPGWDAETVQRLGRDWYWEVDHRRYGFSYSDGFLQVFYGRRGGACEDSSLQQQWSCFVPWRSWRHVRRSLYGLQGELFETVPERADYETWRALEDACPTARFSFEDYDGKVIVATTRIEEREWRLGEGWFKWLSWFRRPKIRRSLDLSFSDEVGPEKGSWKGGTIGHSIDMLPGELHEAAFRRYCEQEHRAKGRRYRIKYLMPVGA